MSNVYFKMKEARKVEEEVREAPPLQTKKVIHNAPIALHSN